MKKLLILFCLLLSACAPVTPAPTPTAVSIRVPMFDSADWVNDWDMDSESERRVFRQFWAVGVEASTKWESYITNHVKTKDEISKYYMSELARRGYQVRSNRYAADMQKGLLEFGKGDARIYVLYLLDMAPTLIMVTYKNVES